MPGSSQRMPAVPLPGLGIEVLGNYLASLGLLRLLAPSWPAVRIAWHDRIFYVVGGPGDLDALVDVLVTIAHSEGWTPYYRGWLDDQKKSKQRKSGRPLALWQANASEQIIELFAAHAVPRERVAFNPLLGSGGNAGQREFAKGWRAAVDALKKPRKIDSRDECRRWLSGEPVRWLVSGIAAASWFSAANKLYNSGQGASRDEPLSPWAMALACEGLPFFAGASSRRLGARARGHGAFPFVCEAAAPRTAGEAGRDRGELWVPVWERPMTLPEVRTLFYRGRAEVRGRGANTPAAFAAAVVQRGIDAGISHFVRFALGATTSANTFEPRHEGIIDVRRHDGRVKAPVRSATVERLLGLVERLPADRKVGQGWRFVGLRGPIEAALVRLAQAPAEAEAFVALLDAVVAALDRVDRNTGHRKARVWWEPIPIEELFALFDEQVPGLEARLAAALVSGFPPARPFSVYRFGVEWKRNRFEHTETPPARWVSRGGPLPRMLTDIVLRRVLDWEGESKGGIEAQARRFPIPASADDVQQWLDGHVDEALLARWLGRMALLDWRELPNPVRERFQTGEASFAPDGALLMVGLLQPLFDARPLRLLGQPERGDVFSNESGARTPAAARAIAHLIQAGQVDTAMRLAASRYAMADVPMVRTDATWRVAESDRLLAATLFPITDVDRSSLVERWLRPQRIRGEHAHA